MILLSPDAVEDVERLRAFLDQSNPDAAQRALAPIWTAIERLQEFPDLGMTTEDRDIRQIVVRFGSSGYIVRTPPCLRMGMSSSPGYGTGARHELEADFSRRSPDERRVRRSSKSEGGSDIRELRSRMSLTLMRAETVGRLNMATSETFILRAALDGQRSIYREIEIESSKSLYRLAEAITNAFGFDFDHAFGFYSGLTPAKLTRVDPRYELFADMGEADPGVFSVKRTKVSQAFPAIGHILIFLFDYGDEWRFRVSLKQVGKKLPKGRYPRIVTIRGDAPPQYPDADEDIDDGEERRGINPLTGEVIKFGKG
jgi:plasmid stabilization system protein ParE